MGSKYDVGPKLGIQGEKEFRKAINDISTNIKTLGTEMLAVASAYDANDKSTAALTSRNKVLVKQIDAQKEKLAKLQEGLTASKEKFGENTEITQRWQQCVNVATANLNKMERQLAENSQALQDNGKELDNASEKTSQFGEKLKNGLAGAAKAAAAAVAAGIAAATAAVGALVKSSLESIGDYEQLTGGVETLFKDSEDTVMEYANNAYRTAGLSANEYMETVTSFSASLLQSLGGDTEKAAQVADMAITDMADNANKMGSDMESLQNAYNGFAKGQFNMLDNLKLGYGGTKEEMQRLLDDAEKLSGQKFDISSYADIAEAIHVVQTEMGITGTTAKEAASTIQGSVSAAKSAWTNLVTGLGDENANLEQLTTNFIDAVATAGENIIPRVEQILAGIGQAVQQLAPILVEQIPGIISGVLPSLLDAGTTLIMALLEGVTAALPELAPAAVDVVNTIVTSISENLPMILTAAMETILALAVGIADSLPELIPTVVDMVLQIVETLIDNVDLLVDASIAIIVSLADGLIEALPRLLEKAPLIIEKLVNAIAENLPKVLQTGIELIVKLAAGVIQNIPTLVKAVPEVIGALIAGFANYYKNLLETGKNLASKVGEGIKNIGASAVQWGRDLIDNFVSGIKNAIGKVKDAVSNVANTVKDFLGFSEPEKGPLSNFHTYAPDMMQLFAKGITDNAGLLKDAFGRSLDFQSELGDVQRKLDRSMAELAGNASATVRVSGSAAGPQEAGISSSVLAELPALIAEAVHKEFEGMGVYLQMRKVGEMTSQWQANNARAMGV